MKIDNVMRPAYVFSRPYIFFDYAYQIWKMTIDVLQ